MRVLIINTSERISLGKESSRLSGNVSLFGQIIFSAGRIFLGYPLPIRGSMSPGFRFSKRQISFTCIGLIRACCPCTIFNKSSPPANLLFGRCMTCGNVPPSAIIPTLANHSKTNAETATFSVFPGTTTCLTASSRKNRAYSLRQE